MSKSPAVLVLTVVALLAAGCGSSNKTTTSTASTTPATSATSAPATPAGTEITTAAVSGVGTVLVNAQGKTLYIFEPDHAKTVTCIAGCAAVWPPVKLTGSKAVGEGVVKASLLGSATDPSGGKVVTYDGWPLYTYVADGSPGTATGEGIDQSGGLWYVISPTGTVVKKKS